MRVVITVEVLPEVPARHEHARCESTCGTLGRCALYAGHLNDPEPGQRRHMNTRGDTWAFGDGEQS